MPTPEHSSRDARADQRSATSARLAAAEAHLRRGEVGRAEAIYLEVLEAAPDSARALNSLGIIAAERGRVELAEQRFRAAVIADPADAAGYANLGKALAARGRLEEAVAELDRALAIEAGRAGAQLARANALARLGRFDEAVRGFEATLALDAKSPAALCNLGAVYQEVGRTRDAVSCFARATVLRPDFVLAHSNLGLALKELGEIEEAVVCCRRAADLEPGSVEAQLNLGVVLKEAGDLRGALEAYDRAARIEPGRAATDLNRGNAHKAAGALDEALECYARAVELEPTLAQGYGNLASVHLLRGEPRRALESCDRYLQRFPADSRVTAARVVALHELGAADELRALLSFDDLVWQRSLDAVPEHESARELNDALVSHILAHPSLIPSPRSHATREAEHTGELLLEPLGPMGAFRAAVLREVERYAAAQAAANPPLPYFRVRARSPRLSAWAVVMRGRGHQIAHIHPTAWLSGVYYATVPPIVDAAPAGGGAGWIEFGDPGEDFHHTKPLPTRRYRPRPGTLLLFPSYLYHRTIPYRASEARISVAFDVLLDS